MCSLVLGHGALSSWMITIQRDLLRCLYKKDITVKQNETERKRTKVQEPEYRRKSTQFIQADRNLVKGSHIQHLRVKIQVQGKSIKVFCGSLPVIASG